jgi:hypothetical protein
LNSTTLLNGLSAGTASNTTAGGATHRSEPSVLCPGAPPGARLVDVVPPENLELADAYPGGLEHDDR